MNDTQIPIPSRAPVFSKSAVAKFICVSLAALLGACATSSETQKLSDSTRTEIYHRARTEFNSGTFLKPREASETEAAFKLAPIVIQEVRSTTTNTTQSTTGSSATSTNDPVMFSVANETSIHNQTYEQ